MKIHISLFAFLLIGLLSLQAQQVEVSYEVLDQEVHVWLQSTHDQEVVLNAINLSLAHEASVEVAALSSSLFADTWSTHLQESKHLKDLSLTYDGMLLKQRFQYGNAEPGLPTTQSLIVPAKTEAPLLVMVIELKGSDEPKVYLEHQTENALNQLGGSHIEPIEYIIVHPQRQGSGVENLAAELELVLFPNPATQHVTLRLIGERSTAWNYTVADLLGRELLKGELPLDLPNNEVKLQLNDWAEGTYYVSLNDGQGHNRVRKFVIK